MLNMQKMPSTFCAFSCPIDSLLYLIKPNIKNVRMKGLFFAYRLLQALRQVLLPNILQRQSVQLLRRYVRITGGAFQGNFSCSNYILEEVQ